MSFKVNNGNKFGDFGYCPLNRACPLNTRFTVFGENKVRKHLSGASKQVGTVNQHHVLVKFLVIRALQNVRGETRSCP